MSLTLERIEALAPDQESLAAARKLLKPAAWPVLAEGEGLVWGECQGSGATPYRVVISESDAGYKCTCPSRKFPCKHTLALMWMRAEKSTAFAPAPVPGWVKDWLSRRRGPSKAEAKTQSETGQASRPSIRLTEVTEVAAEADPKAEQRAAAARERNRAEREAAVLAGLADLDVWLSDQIQEGMANFVVQAGQACRTIAQRLVDAKALGLAARLDALPARLFTLPGSIRPVAAIRELGQIYLISQAYRRASNLPELLAVEARQVVGWSVTREALLNDPEAMKVEADWQVFAVVSETQPDRLRRVETWLWRQSGAGGMPQCAVLLDFVPVSAGAAGGGFLVGDRFWAQLVFYRSPILLRAHIATMKKGSEQTVESVNLPDDRLSVSYANYERALGLLPWLGPFPLPFRAARVRRQGEQLYLHDAEGELSLPLHSSQAAHALPLAAVGPIDGIGLWNGYEFTLTWAETQLGRWVRA
ncbi:MAG TPA: SWIM zinc finger family protein [Candidatus Angelobacter sp.]|nr:SWIM zinc finger family protein [Candidatus Angelobacter sp.]